MRTSDQNSPNAALIALRDKYRKLAIRTWDRFESATKILKGRYLRSKMLGFQSRRDYYVYAAESVGALTGLSLGVAQDDRSGSAINPESAGQPERTPNSSSTGDSIPAVATEESNG